MRSDVTQFFKAGQTKIEKESKIFINNFFVMSFYADAVVCVYFFMSKSFDEQFEFFFLLERGTKNIIKYNTKLSIDGSNS